MSYSSNVSQESESAKKRSFLDSLSEEEREERKQIQREMLHANYYYGGRTLQQVRETSRKLQAWLERHPDDAQLLGEGESLMMLESAMRH